MNDLSQKYDFLLHPIKDLTKNWNVDIASVLEDYLVELEKISFSFDGGKTKVNFAEASFLIQGTACVWSRKVESLHSLVYQTLEMIKNNRQSKLPSSVDRQGVDNDATFDDHEDKFLDLDDNSDELSKRLVGSGIDVVGISRHSTYFQGSEENRGSPFLNKDGEIINYYRDFWSNNMTPQQRGIVLVEQCFEKELVAPLADAAPSREVVREEDDAPADDYLADLDGVNDVSGGGDTLHDSVDTQVDEVRRQLRPRLVGTDPKSQVEQLPPPTATLDPHCECARWAEKPFRKGKTIKLPGRNSKKRKLNPSFPTIDLFTDFLTSSKRLVGVLSDPVAAEKQKRNLLWKQVKSTHGKRRMDGRPEQGELVEPESDHVFLDDDDDIDPLDDDVDAPELHDLINDVEENNNAKMDVDPANAAHPTPSEMQTYEDLVRHHVDRFYTASKRHIQENALAKRVREWEQTVGHFLHEQDVRPEFDIHKYGDDMVSHFTKVGDTKSFTECVDNEDKWSICRRFAATLQLANDGNFSLSTEAKQLKDSVNIVQLRLLTQDKLRERIGDYVPT